MSNNSMFLASLWRYPVKSMMGEELNTAVITNNGLLGDRSYALLDTQTNKIVSAKNPKKWPEIFYFYARFRETPELNKPIPEVFITLPRIESRRFRPNLIISTTPEQTGFVENDWVGKTIRIGDVKLLITDPCPRCVMPTLAQGDLSKDAKILKTIAENTVHVPFANKSLPSVGVYAKVIQPGVIKRTDVVIVE